MSKVFITIDRNDNNNIVKVFLSLHECVKFTHKLNEDASSWDAATNERQYRYGIKEFEVFGG